MKKVVFFVFTLLLLCFQAQADVGETFSVGIPCGDESVDIPFTILSEEPKTVELAASSGRYRVEAPLTIPQTVRYHDADYTVVSIASRSFVGSWFTSITLPETVTSIGESAFQASDITEMVFPDNVTSIGSSALSMCYQLRSVTLPRMLPVVNRSLFYYCKALTEVIMPEALTEVEYNVFTHCESLASITFNSVTPPEGLRKNILEEVPETCVFYLPRGAKRNYLRDCPPEYESRFISLDNDQIFTNDVDGLSMSFTITNIDNLLVEVGAFGSDSPAIDPAYTGKVTIPDTATFLGHTFTVDAIGYYAFKGCQLSEVDLSGVTIVGVGAFENTPLQEVTIPVGVTNLYSKVFKDCSQLSLLNFESTTPTKVHHDVLDGVPATCIIRIPAGSREAYLQQQFFQEHEKQIQETKLTTTVTVPLTNGSTVGLVFESDNSASGKATFVRMTNPNAKSGLTIPSTVEMNGKTFSVDCIGPLSLSSSLLDSVSVPNSVTTIGAYAFQGSTIQSLSLPDGIIKIDYKALSDCPFLQSVVLPASLQVIESEMFVGDESLLSIVMPRALTEIKYDALDGCKSLQSITFTAATPPADLYYTVCEKVPETCLFYVPRGTKQAYLNTVPYEFKDRFISFDRDQVFTCEVNGLPMKFIIDNVDDLLAKVGCDDNEVPAIDPAYTGKVAIPQTVTFMGRTLTVNTVGHWAFKNCQITGVDLGSVETISVNAFENTQLREVTIPATVDYLFSHVFQNCSQLTSLTFVSPTPPQVDNDVLEGVSDECTIFIPTGSRAAYLQQEFFKNHEAQIVALEDGQLFTNTIDGLDFTFMISDLAQGKVQVGDGNNVAISPTNINKVNLPATANFLGRSFKVDAVGNAAFKATQVANIGLAGVTAIGNESFARTPVERVVIPATVGIIGRRAFVDCDKLWFTRFETTTPPAVDPSAYDGSSSDSWFVVPSGTRANYLANQFFKAHASHVVSFENGQVFTNKVSGLDMTFKIVDMENHICQIGDGTNPAISTDDTGQVTLPTHAVLLTDTFKVQYVGDYAFKGCHFKEIDLRHIITIGVEAFAGGMLTKVIFSGPEGGLLSSMGNGAFLNNHIGSVDLRGTNLTRLPDRAFAHNDISDLKLGDKIQELGDQSFRDNSLSTIDTESVYSLGDESFFDNPVEELYFGKGLQQGLEVVHVGSLTIGGAGASLGLLSVGAAPLAVVTEVITDATILAGACIIIAELRDVWDYLEELRKTREDYKDYKFEFWVDEPVVKSGGTDPYHVVYPAGSTVTYQPVDCWMNYSNQTVQMPDVTEETTVSVTATCIFPGFFSGSKSITVTIKVEPKDPSMKFKDRDIKMALNSSSPVTVDMLYESITTRAAQGVEFSLQAYSATTPASYFDNFLQVQKITGSDNYPRPRLSVDQAKAASFKFEEQSELKSLATERTLRAQLTVQDKQLTDTTRVSMADSIAVDFCTMQVGDVVALPYLYELFPSCYQPASGSQRYAREPHYGVPTMTVVDKDGRSVSAEASAIKLNSQTTSMAGESLLDSVLIYAVKESTAYLRLADPQQPKVFADLKINIVKPATAAKKSTPCEWDFTAKLSEADKKELFETARLRIVHAEEYWRRQDGKDYYATDLGFYGRDYDKQNRPQKWAPVFTNGGKNLPAFEGIEVSVDTEAGQQWRSPVDRIRLYSDREQGRPQVAFNGKTSMHILKPETLKVEGSAVLNVCVKAVALAGSNASALTLQYDYKQDGNSKTYTKEYKQADIAAAANKDSVLTFRLESSVSSDYLTLELTDVELSSIGIRPAATPDTIIDHGVIYVAVNSQKRYRVAGFDKADADKNKMADANGRYALTLKDSLHYESDEVRFDARVDTVSQQAFSGNDVSLINKMTVQKGITRFGKEAFASCDNLADLYLQSTEPDKNQWESKVVADTTRLHVALESLAGYGEKFTDYGERFYSDYTIAEGGVCTLSLPCNAQLVGDATLWIINADTLAPIGWGGQYGISAVYVHDSIIVKNQGSIVRASTGNRNIMLRHTAKASELSYGQNKLVANLTKKKVGNPQGNRYTVANGVMKSLGNDDELPAYTAYVDISGWETPESIDILWEWAGNGSEQQPYLIYLALQMESLSNRVNDMANNFATKHFRLMRDIDFGGKEAAGPNDHNYRPVGMNKYGIDLSAITIEVYDPYGVIEVTADLGLPEIFQGNFDGNGHTISGIYLKKVDNDTMNDCMQGIFGWVGKQGSVKNLTVADSYFSGFNYVGTIVGLNSGVIENCHVKESVTLDVDDYNAYAHGGIAGYNDSKSTVAGCVSEAVFDAHDQYAVSLHHSFAGIVGHNRGIVENCLNLGKTDKFLYGAIVTSDSVGTCTNNFYSDEEFTINDGGSISKGEETMPDGMGNVVKTYGKDDYEGITAYESGLYYNGKYYYIPTIDLITNGENEEILAKYEGKYVNVNNDRVTITTQKEDGEWESKAVSVCMPYNVKIPSKRLNNNEVRHYILHYIDKENQEFVFTNEIGDVLMAGVPYVVVVKKGTFGYNAKNVKIVTEPKKFPISTVNNEPVGWWTGSFRNIYGQELVDMKAYIRQSNGTFKLINKVHPDVWLGCFRSFFYSVDGLEKDRYKMAFRQTTAGEGDDEVTEFPADSYESDCDIDDMDGIAIIHTIDADGTHRYFDLQGRPLNGKPNKGIYIYNGNVYMNKNKK